VAVQGYAPDGTTRYWNHASEQLYGYSAQEAIGRNLVDLIIPPEMRGEVEGAIRQMAETKQPIPASELLLMRKDGSRVAVFSSHTIVQVPGSEPELFCVDIDITKRKLYEKALCQQSDFLKVLLETIPNPIYYKDVDGKYTGCNKAFEEYLGVGRREFLGKTVQEIVPQELADTYCQQDQMLLKQGGKQQYEGLIQDKTKSNIRHVIFDKAALLDKEGKIDGLIGVISDITERKRAEEERDKLQSQINQIQKMESVGRLAGGVAHDFNNMLGVIIGYTQMAIDETAPESSLHQDLLQVLEAAQRSANITRQLLAFARKQPIAPKILNLNETIEQGMLQMLRRLIGENIALAWKPKANLWKVKIDASQLDQLLVNLCANARDSITGAGKLIIRTGKVTLDELFCTHHLGAKPGEYVLLSVADNGCGMNQEVLDNIFEPFFTTKELGQGTGLGLATVYGIVKQNNGFIDVVSAPSQGTTFSLYLPRYRDHADQSQQELSLDSAVGRGYETILLVEDEVMILEMATNMLQSQGYTVLATAMPGEAIKLARQHPGEIHLLITDVIMPEMNGVELADRLHSLYPDMKRLFMSGYTADVIAVHGVLDDERLDYIQKPFLSHVLLAKVAKILSGTPLKP
jgi:PAS domain S-box-containing protein